MIRPGRGKPSAAADSKLRRGPPGPPQKPAGARLDLESLSDSKPVNPEQFSRRSSGDHQLPAAPAGDFAIREKVLKLGRLSKANRLKSIARKPVAKADRRPNSVSVEDLLSLRRCSLDVNRGVSRG
jgi:hypothetical protein